MRKKSYGDKLKHPKWQRRRLEVLQRDNFTCTICGDTESTLHVHHEVYSGEPWDAPLDKLKTVCEDCHTIHHTNPDAEIIRIVQKPAQSGHFKCIYVYAKNGIGMFKKSYETGAVEHMLNMSYETLEFIYGNKPA